MDNIRHMNSMAEKKEDLVNRVAKREMGLHQIDDEAEPSEAVEIRRKAVEKMTGRSLKSIGSVSLDYSSIRNKNAENVIGGTIMPLGIAGPILLNGGIAKGEFYVPMATTEGALIASTSRGMKGITASGGATARIIEDGMARAPVFALDSIADVEKFLKWIKDNTSEIRETAEATTSHGKLKDIMPFVVGNNVWLRFRYGTGDAMGMNMVTIATEAACSYIEQNFKGARCVAVSGNMCSDKKESLINNLYGRGKTVICDATISGKVLASVFKTTAAKANEVNLRKNLLGSARAGSLKYNAHFANTVAAIFAATGQDIAQVVESSSGYTWTEVRGEDLYVSVTLTSLEVGTVGGGTSLPTQTEALSILGVSGAGSPPGSNSSRLAEIISAAVLAGELNLICALSARELGKAHKKLGRNVKDANAELPKNSAD